MNFIKGDLIALAKQGNFNIIGHGCNCQKTWGAGIALQLKNEFPDAYTIDKQYRSENSKDPYMMMGTYSDYYYWEEGKPSFYIINMYTQLYPGLPSPHCIIPFDYDAFALCLRKVNHKFANQSIGLPYIGCGLAGAQEDMILAIIDAELRDMTITMVKYEDNQISQRPMAPTGLGEASFRRKDYNIIGNAIGGGKSMAIPTRTRKDRDNDWGKI